MLVEFLEEALADYKGAIDFLELQIEGLGKRFIKEIDKTIQIIKRYPEGYPQYTAHTRKAKIRVFPFNLIYILVHNKIIIVAVAHNNRKPEFWKDRQ